MDSNGEVLISGCGVAGLTLAYWLRRVGYRPTIVERRRDLSARGYMIDFYGSGYDVAAKMGLLGALGERHYPVPTLDFVDGQGRTRVSLDIERLRALLGYRHYNFLRGDLVDVLYESLGGQVPVRFGTSLTHLEPLPDGVEATFTDGSRATYDLVLGADGIHSKVRELLWGAEDQFERYVGYYVCCAVIEKVLGDGDAFYSYIEPGKQAAVYPIRGGKLATFFIYEAEQHALTTRAVQVAELERVFGNMGWEVPRLLELTASASDFYFDSVSQIEVSPWHKGRVALVGDACQCLSLLAGQGASMAMAGAYILASQLERAEGDHEAAYQAYEARLKPEIDERQEQARKLGSSFVPDSYWSIWALNLFMKLASLPILKGIFLRRIGARSIIH